MTCPPTLWFAIEQQGCVGRPSTLWWPTPTRKVQSSQLKYYDHGEPLPILEWEIKQSNLYPLCPSNVQAKWYLRVTKSRPVNHDTTPTTFRASPWISLAISLVITALFSPLRIQPCQPVCPQAWWILSRCMASLTYSWVPKKHPNW